MKQNNWFWQFISNGCGGVFLCVCAGVRQRVINYNAIQLSMIQFHTRKVWNCAEGRTDSKNLLWKEGSGQNGGTVFFWCRFSSQVETKHPKESRLSCQMLNLPSQDERRKPCWCELWYEWLDHSGLLSCSRVLQRRGDKWNGLEFRSLQQVGSEETRCKTTTINRLFRFSSSWLIGTDSFLVCSFFSCFCWKFNERRIAKRMTEQ